MSILSIVIPVYNGEATISFLVEQLIETLNSELLEIILINDCSIDNSEIACVELHNKYPEIVRFFSLAKNVGEHNAVMAGLNQVRGQYVVIMDDDLQNPICEVRKLLNQIQGNDVDVVYTYYEKKEHSFFRNLGSLFNDKVANVMLDKPKDLYLSSFKIINRFLVDELIKYNLPFPYIDGLILRTTIKIGKIQVMDWNRYLGKS